MPASALSFRSAASQDADLDRRTILAAPAVAIQSRLALPTRSRLVLDRPAPTKFERSRIVKIAQAFIDSLQLAEVGKLRIKLKIILE